MGEETGLVALLDALRRRWRLAVLVAVPLILGAAWYAESLPDEFEAEAVVAYRPLPDNTIGAGEMQLLLPQYAVYVTAEATMIRAARAAGLVFDDLEPAVDVAVTAQTANIVITVVMEDPDAAADGANALAAEAVAFSANDPNLRGIVVSAAPIPGAPSGPPRRLLELAAGVVAVLAGIAAAVLGERLRPRVRTAEEITEATGLPVIGTLPLSPSVTRRITEALANPSVGGHVRTLRTNLGRSTSADSVRMVMVTSANSGEGKTTVASLFAASLALVDVDVLLVDADLLRPAIAARLGIPGSPGLADVLRGDAPMEPVHPYDALPRLAVLPTTIAPDGGDLLVRRFAAVMAEAIERYQLIVVDAPPLLGSDAARTLATVADGVLLVVSGGSSVADLKEAVAALDTLSVRTLGVVGNRLADRPAYTYTYTPQVVDPTA